MPLTAALQARLKRRGIVTKDVDVEEPKEEEPTGSQQVGPVKGCPNRSNPHHECVEYCRTRWGASDPTQAPHIKDYSHVPLPPGWYFVPDYSNGKHYYWNTTTNQVSWLHPLDSNADITLPVSVVNKQNKDSDVEPNREIPSPLVSVGNEIQDREQLLSIGRHPSLLKGSQKRQEAAEKRKLSEKDTKSKRSKSDELDPMDPAAYSDTPRGDWSTGLQQKGDAKTGVDVTANGPLFQQRPYPSPGDILRQNRKLSAGGE